MPSGNLCYIPRHSTPPIGRTTPPPLRPWEVPIVLSREPVLHRKCCWICHYPMLEACSSSHDLRVSRDHVSDGLTVRIRLAHRWCNSRRGRADTPLSDEIRRACQMHVWDKHQEYWAAVGIVRQA